MIKKKLLKSKNFFLISFLIMLVFLFSCIFYSHLQKSKINKFQNNYPSLSLFIDESNKTLTSNTYSNGMLKYFKLMFGKGKIYKVLIDKQSNKFFSFYLLKGKLNGKSVNFFIKGLNIKNKIIFFDNNIYPLNKNIKSINDAINSLTYLNDDKYCVNIDKSDIEIILNDFDNKKITINQKIKLKKGSFVKNLIFYLSDFYIIKEIKINNKKISYNFLKIYSDQDMFKTNVNLYYIDVSRFKNDIFLNISYTFNFNKIKKIVAPVIFCESDNNNLKYFSIGALHSQNIFNLFPFNNFICNYHKLKLKFINNTDKNIYSNLDNGITKNIALSNISLLFSETQPITLEVENVKYCFFIDRTIFKEKNYKLFINKLKIVLKKMNKQLQSIIGTNFSVLSDKYYIVQSNYRVTSFCQPLDIMFDFYKNNKRIDYSFNIIYLALFHELMHYFSGYKIKFSEYNENYVFLNETLTQFFEYSNLTVDMFPEYLRKKFNIKNKFDIIKTCLLIELENYTKAGKNRDIPVLMRLDSNIANQYKYDISILYFYYLYYLTSKEAITKTINLLLNSNIKSFYFENYLNAIKQSVSEEKYRTIENFIYEMLFTDSVDFEKYGRPEDVAKYIGNIFGKSILEGVGE